MRSDAKAERAEKIEQAAYKLLEEKGFEGLSIIAVARAAKASNETIYRWYGDKLGLIETLIRKNADRITAQISVIEDDDCQQALHMLGTALLQMLLGPQAIALNRAAAADPTGTLGRALRQLGRETVLPRITDQMAQSISAGLVGGTPDDLAETWVALLVGDLQIRCVTHAIAPPPPDRLIARSHRAAEQLIQLFPPN